MVEEISNGQFSPEVVSKMTELEKALTVFLEEQCQEKYQRKWSPRPPGTPPPFQMLQNTDGTTQEVSLVKAEVALEKLRERLRREEEALRRAEEALQQSIQEEEILRRAEEALQRSREAADQRKLEAIQQTEAAVASAEQARRDTEEAHQAWNQEQSTTRNYEEQVEVEDLYDVAFFNHDDESILRGMEAPRSTIPLEFLIGSNGTPLDYPGEVNGIRDDCVQAPAEIPTLSNWVQYIDGSIHGQISNSDKFPDGASISTSAVKQGATGGSIIETSSGSKYYLESPGTANIESTTCSATQDGDESYSNPTVTSSPRMANAPEGVPSILSWQSLGDGGISGLVYGSPSACDGDYIETSPIAEGPKESGQIVTTQSGSQYFLSPDEAEKAANSVAAFQDLAGARRGSTITINKELANRNARFIRETTENGSSTDASKAPSKLRPTFSLFDLFGPKKQMNMGRKTGPDGIPMLTEWSSNADGTITGYVSGSSSVSDGSMVTTSPVVTGIAKQYEKVTTATGSTYYLG